MPILDEYGNIRWWTLHAEAASYPGHDGPPTEEERKAFTGYLENYSTIFPCPICRPHFQSYLKSNPVFPATDSRQNLFLWMMEFHQHVNVNKSPDGRLFEGTPQEVFDAFQGGVRWKRFGKFLVLGKDEVDDDYKPISDSNCEQHKVDKSIQSSSQSEKPPSTLKEKTENWLKNTVYPENPWAQTGLWISLFVMVAVSLALAIGWTIYALNKPSPVCISVQAPNPPPPVQYQVQAPVPQQSVLTQPAPVIVN